jgi:periplasmic divalent cation tolerance protein
MNQQALIVWVSHPVTNAKELAQRLVEKRLAACAQVLPPMTSIYHWQGQIQQDEECLILLKTLSSRWEELCTFITQHHPYSVPEIIAVESVKVLESYFQWLQLEMEGEAST